MSNFKVNAVKLSDRITEDGFRHTAFELHYHRYILPEVNTHRALSKNGASSRAIPTGRLIEMAIEERVEPVEWGLHQPGMQAFNLASPELEAEGRAIWDEARADAIRHATALSEKGFAKQIVNRVLEPYLSTRTVLSGTDWNNLLALRDHKDAQPEFRDLARIIGPILRDTKPTILYPGEWTKPYIEADDYEIAKRFLGSDLLLAVKDLLYSKIEDFASDLEIILLMVSAARCARVTAKTRDGTPVNFEKDLDLFQRLVKAQPVHASPTEHQATFYPGKVKSHITANLTGFAQFRRFIKNETVYG